MSNTRNWELVAGRIVEEDDLPNDWVVQNNQTEELLRRRVKAAKKSILDDDNFLPCVCRIKGAISPKQVEDAQLSLYSFFFATSFKLTWEILDKLSPLFPCRSRICSMGPATYLQQLIGDLFCMRVVVHRSDDLWALLLVGVATVTLLRTDLLSWDGYLNMASDEPKFMSEMGVRMHKSLADAIGLPTDEGALEAARHHSLGTRLLIVTAREHARMCDDPAYMANLRSLLESD